MKNLIIIGDGGHSNVVQSIVENSEYQVIEIWDDKYHNTFSENGILYGPINRCSHHLGNKKIYFFIAFGDNLAREKMANILNIEEERYAIIHSPSAIISSKAKISAGTLIMAGAIVQPGCQIGRQVIINTGSIVEHDCKIDNYVHIAPGVTLTGHCCINKGSLIGANSVLIPKVHIGENVIIGAGSTITKNVSANQTVYGHV
ncbi:acetyltransferase [Listeria fleischmannii]|uniref:Acetyltransferase n=1 Tax=Listeria fleischmannii TaxID=1069827 RepID=A0A841YBI0_9LIST|nr:acetyltransferase [Listeria fleischmannii]EIA21108.1 sugar O-acyltransferase, sialic acid O-acetyltransferase NeuD family protein [Listeria fleischmannii subsp. coloradonensis]MBC1397621.1 acetyltransferase [Listeria fleischmannii]MBC1426838.1 acetyltransferase [Listeria fleischmannii]STY33705.1 2,3,4,5-tetrahydropyridine-2,6-dicarboxylate N-acetyltransferase [Listeria fleischmannii subsp. coloradonensis]